MIPGGQAGTTPASAGGSAPVSGRAETPLIWAESILAAMGWPETQSNIDAMVAWEMAEGGNWENPDSANPLDTTMPMPGARSTNSAGVKAYTSWAQGLAATVKTLQLSAYGPIRQAFASGNASNFLPSALNQTPWGTSGSTVAGILSSKGYQQYELRTGGSSPGGAGTSSSGNVGTGASPSGCAFGVGPFCILSQAGLNRFYGALLMAAGGLVLTVGLGLVVVGALAETKLGRATSKTFGAAGLGTVVGAAAAPSRAVSGRRQARAAAQEQSQRKAADTAHRQALRRAQLRSARARARRAEEGVRTQRAITQGRNDSATIRDYERNEGAQRRRQAVESRRAGRSVAAMNRRRIAQRQKFEDVFGEAS